MYPAAPCDGGELRESFGNFGRCEPQLAADRHAGQGPDEMMASRRFDLESGAVNMEPQFRAGRFHAACAEGVVRLLADRQHRATGSGGQAGTVGIIAV